MAGTRLRQGFAEAFLFWLVEAFAVAARPGKAWWIVGRGVIWRPQAHLLRWQQHNMVEQA
jgi:hypothetical protein